MTDGSISRRDFITRAAATGIGAAGAIFLANANAIAAAGGSKNGFAVYAGQDGTPLPPASGGGGQRPRCGHRKPDPWRRRRAQHHPVAGRHHGQCPCVGWHKGLHHRRHGSGTADELPARRRRSFPTWSPKFPQSRTASSPRTSAPLPSSCTRVCSGAMVNPYLP